MFDFLFHPQIQSIPALLIPVLFLPLLMRFIVSRFLLFRVKRKYLPGYLRKLVDGWKTETDRKALEQVNDYALKRMKYHFVFKPDFITDMKAILLNIKAVYEPASDSPDAVFSFSIAGLAECALLAFSDIYREYGDKPWFKAIRNLKLIWFFRVRRLQKIYHMLFSHPLFEQIQRFRLSGRIFRILLIPVLGFPQIIWYAVQSIFISIFTEGFFRFFYGLLLLKFGYYSLYLYGKENSHIKKRITLIPKKKLSEMNRQIQAMILPSGWEKKSRIFPGAVSVYLSMLKESGIVQDPEVIESARTFLEKTKDLIGRIRGTIKRAYDKHNPFSGKEDSDWIKVRNLFYAVGREYTKGSDTPLVRLRINEIVAAGYMASVMIFHKLFSTPGLRLILDKIPVSFALKLVKTAKTDAIKMGMDTAKEAMKYYRLFRLGYRAYKIVRGIVSPYTLVWTLANPIVFQQVKDLLNEYIAHRTGRLLLYTWESSVLKKKSSLTPILW
jgi:hypothetical protein